MKYLLRNFMCFIPAITVLAQVLPPGFVAREIAGGLDPTDLVIAPDNRIFITIKSGKIFVVENDQLLPNTFLDISSQVDNFNERGLGHMVLDPDFEQNNYYYVFYTVKNTNRNRISRFTANGNVTLPGSEVILLELDVMSGSIHNGGDMALARMANCMFPRAMAPTRPLPSRKTAC
jgi:glucose/arabinose dehydrogenase